VRDGEVRMELIGNMGLAGFDILWKSKGALAGGEGGSPRKMQFAGSNGWRLLYTQPCWGIQNGNSGSKAEIPVNMLAPFVPNRRAYETA
jgi:hypothetical protein